MSKEIKELDMNKYLVIKTADLDNYIGKGLDRNIFEAVCKKIEHLRTKEGKPDNKYLVLNLDDDFSIHYLFQRIALLNEKTRFNQKWRELKIKDIAVDLVNAILKTKE